MLIRPLGARLEIQSVHANTLVGRAAREASTGFMEKERRLHRRSVDKVFTVADRKKEKVERRRALRVDVRSGNRLRLQELESSGDRRSSTPVRCVFKSRNLNEGC